MLESIQLFMMFCMTIIAVVGIVSAVIYYSRDTVSFNIKAHTKLFSKSETEFSMNVRKEKRK